MIKHHELIAWITEQSIELDWQEAKEPLTEWQIALQERLFASSRPVGGMLLILGASDRKVPLSPSLTYLREIAGVFVRALTMDSGIEFIRHQTVVCFDDQNAVQLLQNAPFLPGNFIATITWLHSIWRIMQDQFRQQIERWPGTVETYLQHLAPDLHVADRICFHLVENKDTVYPFAFLATCADIDSATGQLRHSPLQQLIRDLAEPGSTSPKDQTDKAANQNQTLNQLRLLAAVHRAGEKSQLIRQWLSSGEIFHPLRLTAREAYIFLKEIPIFESCNIVCRIPKWWLRKKQSAGIQMTVGEKPAKRLGLDALLDFKLEFVLNGETLTEDEIRSIVEGSAGLAMIKGKWIEVDTQHLTKLLSSYEHIQKMVAKTGISVLDAFRLQMQPDRLLPGLTAPDGLIVTQGDWLQTHLLRLAPNQAQQSVDPGQDFHARLRPYQQIGLNWLAEMDRLKLGACLADDMGLGKTIQVIALLNARRWQWTEDQNRLTLLIMPATLMANWANELDRFAPAIRYQILHSSAVDLNRISPDDLPASLDVLITTYGMVERMTWLKDLHFDMIVLDEAQAIKNPGARQTRAVKALQANVRFALTGTPIENCLSDLWSLFDFLNKGLLGTPSEFTAFSRKLKSQPEGYGRLREVISPFLLRRVKTDPSIISDLPDKVEMRVFSALSKKQAALYQSTIEDLERRLQAVSEGIERKGLILKTILNLKQICNHPDLFHGQNAFARSESGKYDRLQEICETIRDHRERVLIFTQFREMCEPLSHFLESIFGRPGLVLHGQVPIAKRRRIVEQFQGTDYVPFLVLSLKAGGTGLNLTAANHVVHFDRWWNPAVENQATDRAFRIGQNKRVIVHTFVTSGTVEEKIDALIESKKQLVKDVIADRQESFITELDNQQLMNLLRLET